eukprot:TRINITY_DN15951_c0_g2_i1.p1 TRINITY_DN15951_c0_g2~~TRINITY_DN15951_c0_g2_i1.p1  ORF type:complete len:377 (+),score=63.27 TRINITY_DN15951_c0_g2_i1:112-1131(+)
MCETSAEVRRLLLHYRLIGITFEVVFSFEKMLPPETYEIPHISIEKKLLLEPSVVSEEYLEDLAKSKGYKNYRFFLDLFSKLFLDCDLTGSKGYKLREDESFFLSCFYSKEMVMKPFNVITERLGVEALSKVFSHLCTSNKDISAALMNILFDLIANASMNELYGYVAAIEKVVGIDDELSAGRVNLFVKLIGQVMTKFPLSYATCTYIIDCFIRLALKCVFLRSKMIINPNDYKFIKVWLGENSYPDHRKVLGSNRRTTGCSPAACSSRSKRPSPALVSFCGYGVDKELFKEYSNARVKLLNQLETKSANGLGNMAVGEKYKDMLTLRKSKATTVDIR